MIPWVFHRNGVPIRSFYGVWRSPCDRADYGGKGPKETTRVVLYPNLLTRTEADGEGRIRQVRPYPHDFRRTAVRRQERAGVPRAVAKQLTGHLTDAMYERYDIASDADLREAVEKIAGKVNHTAKVIPLTAKRRA